MRSTLLQALLATALTAALYTTGLDRVPPYLLHDEIKAALQAHSLVDTGRDLNGRRLPLYFPEPGFSAGRDPVSIYVTAAVLTVLPLSEATIRLPSALVGSLGVGLTLVVARLWFPGTVLPWVAAAILALAPGYFIHSRLAHQVIYPVPFALLWLICLTFYVRDGRRWQAAACGLTLAAGLYSYLAAFITMPVCLAATAVLMGWRRDWRAVRAMAAAFALMLVPLLLWQFAQPGRYGDILGSYGLAGAPDAAAAGPAGLAAAGEAVRVRIDTFWDAFNPSRLFFTGESSLNVSTRQAGILLLPVAVFLVAGIARILPAPTPLGVVLLAMVVAAPLPAVVMVDVEIRRWLVALPFAALLATYGVQTMFGGGRAALAVAVILLTLMPQHFAGFARDYFTGYPLRAGVWFGGNIRGAVHAVLDHANEADVPVVYLDRQVPYVDAYWRFYVTARGPRAIMDRAVCTDDFPSVDEVPIGTLFLTHAGETASGTLARAGWATVAVVHELDGTPSFAVLVKDSVP